jgi:membrane protein implicated in regulation of membrane protease activity
MERAIRRLNILEYIIIAAAFVLALGGGGLAAYILSSGTALPFRLTWAAISLLLFIVPGLIVFGRNRGRRGARPDGSGGRAANDGQA